MQPEKEEEFKKFRGRREPGHSGLRIAPKRASALEDGEPYLTMKHSQLQDGRNGQEKPIYRGAIYGPERGSNFRRGSAEAVAAEKVACFALLAQTWARRTVRGDFSLVAFQSVTPESCSKETTHGRAPSGVL
jgi:hypothetical protein